MLVSKSQGKKAPSGLGTLFFAQLQSARPRIFGYLETVTRVKKIGLAHRAVMGLGL